MLKSPTEFSPTEKPTAGDSFPVLAQDANSTDSSGATPNTWSSCDPSSFNLRVGPEYSRNKKKSPSCGSLLEIVGVDCYQSEKRIDDIGSKVNFPAAWRDLDTHSAGVPPLFIINFQIPSEFPTSLFKEITDGPGWSLVLYFRMSQETADSLIDPSTATPGARLYSNYCTQAPEANIHTSSSSSPWKARFKATMRCQNIDEFGLPSFISSYNGQPVLIRHTGTLIRGDGYIEMDINVHRFASVPKKALQILMKNFDRMTVNMGFCIEGKEESEMPEVLLGCLALHKPSVDKHPVWDK